MNPDPTLTVTKNCPKDGVHLSKSTTASTHESADDRLSIFASVVKAATRQLQSSHLGYFLEFATDAIGEGNMLKIRELVKVYPGPVAALQGIDLEVKPGMFGLLGPNGAGKTTLMRIVRKEGINVTALAPHSQQLGSGRISLRRMCRRYQ